MCFRHWLIILLIGLSLAEAKRKGQLIVMSGGGGGPPHGGGNAQIIPLPIPYPIPMPMGQSAMASPIYISQPAMPLYNHDSYGYDAYRHQHHHYSASPTIQLPVYKHQDYQASYSLPAMYMSAAYTPQILSGEHQYGSFADPAYDAGIAHRRNGISHLNSVDSLDQQSLDLFVKRARHKRLNEADYLRKNAINSELVSQLKLLPNGYSQLSVRKAYLLRKDKKSGLKQVRKRPVIQKLNEEATVVGGFSAMDTRHEQVRQEQMRQEQMRQEQMRQEQITQEQMKPASLETVSAPSINYASEASALLYSQSDTPLAGSTR